MMSFTVPPQGRAFNAVELSEFEAERTRRKLAEEFPELKERALEALLASKRAERELDAAKVELRRHLGPDTAKQALDGLSVEAENRLKLESAVARAQVKATAAQAPQQSIQLEAPQPAPSPSRRRN